MWKPKFKRGNGFLPNTRRALVMSIVNHPRTHGFNVSCFVLMKHGSKAYISEWLLGQPVPQETLDFVYSTGTSGQTLFSEQQVKQCAERAMRWFERSGMLLDEGRSGVWEGLGTEIYPDGMQRKNKTRRVDC